MIKSGDVGFIIHRNSRMSRLIAWFMKSKWSHSFLVLEVTPERVYILETSDFQVIISPLSKYTDSDNCDMAIYRFDSLDGHKTELEETLKECHGLLYGYTQLISLGFRRLLMRIGITINNFFRQGIVCCGVPLTFLSKCPNSPYFKKDPEALDTEELYQLTMQYATKVYEK